MNDINDIGDRPIMPFGIHSGDYIEDLPKKYLLWLMNQEWFEEKFLKYYIFIDELLERRENEEHKHEI